jgi:predicted  nucleic acid-binding Zn-ribbon protein
MAQVQLLYRLQQIDSEIREKKQRLGEVIRAQKESEALLAARRRAETAAADLQAKRLRHNKLSAELVGLNNKAHSSENRLYSGSVKNPKELSDLQHEIESLGRRRAGLEDEILEAMILLEDGETEKSAADEALAHLEAAREKALVGLKQEQNELALRLHALAGLRQELLPRITAEAMREYEEIGRRRGGVAVVGLRDNVCLGCQLSTSAKKVREAREGKLVYCGGCGRILQPL